VPSLNCMKCFYSVTASSSMQLSSCCNNLSLLIWSTTSRTSIFALPLPRGKGRRYVFQQAFLRLIGENLFLTPLFRIHTQNRVSYFVVDFVFHMFFSAGFAQNVTRPTCLKYRGKHLLRFQRTSKLWLAYVVLVVANVKTPFLSSWPRHILCKSSRKEHMEHEIDDEIVYPVLSVDPEPGSKINFPQW